MPKSDEQREQEKLRTQDATQRMESSRRESSDAGAEKPDSIAKPDSRRQDPHHQVDRSDRKRAIAIGGIARQVDQIQQSYLAYVHAHRDRLQKRLTESFEHETKFLGEVQSVREQIRQLLEAEEADDEEE